MLQIEWRKTQEDGMSEKEDYTASFQGTDIGRVYENFNAGKGVFWQWFAWFHVVPNGGSTDSRREAMLAIEEQFEKWWSDPANRTKDPFSKN